MKASYAVVWRRSSGPLYAGKLELAGGEVVLDGAALHDSVRQRLPYQDLALVRIGRGAADRLDGHPALILELRDGEQLRIASALGGLGVIRELAEALIPLALGPALL